MEFLLIRDDKKNPEKITMMIVGTHTSKETKLLDCLEVRIQKGLKIGKVQDGKIVVFFYKHVKKEVVEEDIDHVVSVKPHSFKAVAEFIQGHVVAERIISYDKYQYNFGALKIKRHEPRKPWYKRLFG